MKDVVEMESLKVKDRVRGKDGPAYIKHDTPVMEATVTELYPHCPGIVCLDDWAQVEASTLLKVLSTG